jgi:hypothetical protein
MTAIGVTVLIALVSVLIGFLWLPLAQPDSSFRSAWDAFCSSAGLIRARTVSEVVTNTSYRTSAVVISSDTLQTATPESVGRGATTNWAVSGSKASRQPICAPNWRRLHPAIATTTSASRCAMLRVT